MPADVLLLLDASESMALNDDGVSRWSQAVDLMHKTIADDELISREPEPIPIWCRLQAVEKLPWSKDYSATTDSAATRT